MEQISDYYASPFFCIWVQTNSLTTCSTINTHQEYSFLSTGEDVTKARSDNEVLQWDLNELERDPNENKFECSFLGRETEELSGSKTAANAYGNLTLGSFLRDWKQSRKRKHGFNLRALLTNNGRVQGRGRCVLNSLTGKLKEWNGNITGLVEVNAPITRTLLT